MIFLSSSLSAQPTLVGALFVEIRFSEHKTSRMFRAIGVVIILWGISLFFGSSIKALDQAATATFQTLETAAVVSEIQIEHITHK